MTKVEFGDTFKVNFPSKSVIVPFDVPFSRMFTPIKGSPVESTIRPEI